MTCRRLFHGKGEYAIPYLKEQIAEILPQVLQHYRQLHTYPELSSQEQQTAAYIAQVLEEMGLEVTRGIGGNGVSALIEGSGPGKCVALRADLDALPIPEQTGVSFVSQVPGIMHACGHDAHSAMLLGTAQMLLQMRDQFCGCVKLVFQPAEEDNLNSGAKKMIEGGILNGPKVDAMLGLHVWPGYPTGTVALRNGAMMAASDRFYITIRGKMSHGSQPDNGVDAIVIAAQVVSTLQTIVSRSVGPLDSAVITIGEIQGGKRYNVVADEVFMSGTCRNLNHRVRQEIPRRMQRIIRSVAEGMGGSCDFTYHYGYSITENHPQLFSLIRQCVTEQLGSSALVVPEHPALAGEDFSFYGEHVPCGYFWLGCHEEGTPFFPLHNPRFLPSLECFPVGMEVMASAALRFLQNDG